MPGSLNLSGIRNTLTADWGFGTGRQDSVLLDALRSQPAVRLENETFAKEFWTRMAQNHISENNLVIEREQASSGGTESSIQIDPELLRSLQHDQKDLHQRILGVYAKHLGLNLDAQSDEVILLQQQIQTLQKEIDVWNVEHGPEYATGIKSLFDSRKIRSFDSSWNWVLQDFLSVYHRLLDKELLLETEDLHNIRQRLVGRSSFRLVDLINFTIEKRPASQNCSNFEHIVSWLKDLATACVSALSENPAAVKQPYTTAPCTTIDAEGVIRYTETRRSTAVMIDSSTAKSLESSALAISDCLGEDAIGSSNSSDTIQVNADCPLRIQTSESGIWRDSWALTQQYMEVLDSTTTRGLEFSRRNVLLTGAGPGSIGAEILRGLLSGGARVIVTTSSCSPASFNHYQRMFSQFGSASSQLTVVPFNQGSQQDIEKLISYIYDEAKNFDLDHIIPFAAVSEHTNGLDDINSKSEVAHRIMLTNVLRLLGAVKRAKQVRGIRTRPAQVILPLSPNHGAFGNDGLYAESKLGLEALTAKWSSEDWSEYLSICGAVIGWTRGTALMADNDLLSEGIEKLGVYTFSQGEMAFNIMALMSPGLLQMSQLGPLMADLSGGLNMIPDFKDCLRQVRAEIQEKSSVRRAICAEQKILDVAASLANSPNTTHKQCRANISLTFPRLPDFDKEIRPLQELNGMVDLERVVVITGFAELGPWGNSKTRWEMEAFGEFSLEGCIELAWIMGLIRYRSDEQHHLGWVDASTNEPVEDSDVKLKYEGYILEHTGIRLIEPRVFDGDDPMTKQFLHEIEVQADLEPFEASREVALDFVREHKGRVIVTNVQGSDQVLVTLKKGARLLIPKALKTDRFVGGQIPTGWSPAAYGIQDDIASQVDPTTLYALVCTAEALISAGITDPYEFYKYIHVSELGNCVGSGLGGSTALQNLFKERYLDKSIAKDVLAESFINTGAAWINMLLLSAAGPINTPVGACATAIESVDVGFDLIMARKAKVVLVGGYDGLSKDVAYEFGNMKATNSAVDDLACGRTPAEMSRPATSTRNGFVESEGSGIQIMTTASLALEMGLPIRGVIALARTASDKTGRSLPAPGRGILTSVSEACHESKFDSPLLSLSYRKKCINLRMQQIKDTEALQMAYLEEELASFSGQDVDFCIRDYRRHRLEGISAETDRQKCEILNTYGNEFWKRDDRISPLRGSLATWGLTVDDLGVASFHGTSTKKNDINESEVIQTQLTQLGRTKGNPILGVFQKYLTGHPKGAAGAWMLNGCLNILETGIIPGNRNADNIDKELERFDHIVFPNKTIETAGGVKAFSVTSFGFGQKGAQAIGIHPKFLFATIDESRYLEYSSKVKRRQQVANSHFQRMMLRNQLFQAKDIAPYHKDQETSFLINSAARV